LLYIIACTVVPITTVAATASTTSPVSKTTSQFHHPADDASSTTLASRLITNTNTGHPSISTTRTGK